MHPQYVPVDGELLRRLYVDERLTAAEIAARIGCGPITILRRLRQFGIRARPRGPLYQSKTLNGFIRWSPNLEMVAESRLCRWAHRNRRKSLGRRSASLAHVHRP